MTPCYIVTFEIASWPQQLAEQCERLQLRPIIYDNNSSYPPMLEWLDSCPYEVIRSDHNGGCHGFGYAGMHDKQTGPYVLTDCDLDISGVPDDVVAKMTDALVRYPTFGRAGLSLEVDDIPDSYPLKGHVHAREDGFWSTRLDDGCFDAAIDTTFALYDPERDSQRKAHNYRAIRLDRPYTARHIPWYLDLGNPTEEYQYYLERLHGPVVWSKANKHHIEDSQ